MLDSGGVSRSLEAVTETRNPKLFITRFELLLIVCLNGGLVLYRLLMQRKRELELRKLSRVVVVNGNWNSHVCSL